MVAPLIDGRFEVRGELGAGGMGTVVRAYDRDTDREVALKVLLAPEHPQVLERFRREAELTARLRHEGVVRIHGTGEHEGRPYLVYELIEGARTLEEAQGELDRGARLDLLEQVARAVGAAHTLGIVHRDLKPSNVLIDGEGRARVADFGVALDRAADRLTVTGVLVGSPAAMAPEQLAGQKDQMAPPTDVWALTVMLHELLFDRSPFQASTLIELTTQVAAGAVELPADPTVGPALRALIRRGLSTDPGKRPPTGDAFADALVEARAAEEASPRAIPGARLALAVVAIPAAAGLAALLATASTPDATTSDPSTAPSPSPSTTPPKRTTPSPTPSQAPGTTRLNVPRARGLAWLGDDLLVTGSAGTWLFRAPDWREGRRWGSGYTYCAALPQGGALLGNNTGFSLLSKQGRITRLLDVPLASHFALSPDGTSVAWVRGERAHLAELEPGPRLRRRWTRVAPPQERWVTVTRERVYCAAKDTIAAWDRATGEVAPGLPHGATKLGVDGQGTTLACGYAIGMLELRNASTLELLGRLSAEHGVTGPRSAAQVAHLGSIVGLRFFEGRRLLSYDRAGTSRESTVAIWDLATGKRLGWEPAPRGGGYNRAAVRGDGRWVALLRFDPTYLVVRSVEELSRATGQRPR